MNNLDIYCVTNKRIQFLENSSYKLCSVGKNFSHENYQKSDFKQNIFDKEKYYSELTFHYWYWKNLLNLNDDKWIGFCQKRRYCIKQESAGVEINRDNLKSHMLVEADASWTDFDAILCKPIKVSGAKKMKIIKRGWRNILQNPSLLFNENKETIKIHFDMHHGYGRLEKAIELVKHDQVNDFKNYVNNNNEYNPHIMVISKNHILNEWFKDLFDWLFACEKTFGFKNLYGYDSERLYAYLAERYLSFWFRKKTKFLEWPWIFIDN